MVVIALLFIGAGTSTLSCPVASYLPISQPLTYMMQETPQVGMNKKHDTEAGNKAQRYTTECQTCHIIYSTLGILHISIQKTINVVTPT